MAFPPPKSRPARVTASSLPQTLDPTPHPVWCTPIGDSWGIWAPSPEFSVSPQSITYLGSLSRYPGQGSALTSSTFAGFTLRPTSAMPRPRLGNDFLLLSPGATCSTLVGFSTWTPLPPTAWQGHPGPLLTLTSGYHSGLIPDPFLFPRYHLSSRDPPQASPPTSTPLLLPQFAGPQARLHPWPSVTPPLDRPRRLPACCGSSVCSWDRACKIGHQLRVLPS